MKPAQIPDEVVEAALPFAASCAYYCKPSANDCQCRQNTFRAIQAALAAWPGRGWQQMTGPNDRLMSLLILPLPPEGGEG